MDWDYTTFSHQPPANFCPLCRLSDQGGAMTCQSGVEPTILAPHRGRRSWPKLTISFVLNAHRDISSSACGRNRHMRPVRFTARSAKNRFPQPTATMRWNISSLTKRRSTTALTFAWSIHAAGRRRFSSNTKSSPRMGSYRRAAMRECYSPRTEPVEKAELVIYRLSKAFTALSAALRARPGDL